MANDVAIAGAVIFGTSYGLTAIGTGIFTGIASGDTPNCASGQLFALIPLFGGFIAAAKYPNHSRLEADTSSFVKCQDATSLYRGVTIASSVLQLGGIAMLVTGYAVAPDDEPDTAGIVPRFTPGPGDIGLAATWEL